MKVDRKTVRPPVARKMLTGLLGYDLVRDHGPEAILPPVLSQLIVLAEPVDFDLAA